MYNSYCAIIKDYPLEIAKIDGCFKVECFLYRHRCAKDVLLNLQWLQI